MVAVVSSIVSLRSSLTTESRVSEQLPAATPFTDSALLSSSRSGLEILSGATLQVNDSAETDGSEGFDDVLTNFEPPTTEDESLDSRCEVGILQDVIERFLTGLTINMNSNSDCSSALFHCANCNEPQSVERRAQIFDPAVHGVDSLPAKCDAERNALSSSEHQRLMLQHQVAVDIPLGFHTTIAI